MYIPKVIIEDTKTALMFQQIEYSEVSLTSFGDMFALILVTV